MHFRIIIFSLLLSFSAFANQWQSYYQPVNGGWLFWVQNNTSYPIYCEMGTPQGYWSFYVEPYNVSRKYYSPVINPQIYCQ